MSKNKKYMDWVKDSLDKIDELQTEIHKTKTEIKSKHYDDKIYQQSLINVLNNHLTELIELESELV